jgi:hypothetical protein
MSGRAARRNCPVYAHLGGGAAFSAVFSGRTEKFMGTIKVAALVS